VESGQFDTIEVKYSPFNREGEAVIRLAHRRDVGVIGMKPFGGFGMLGSLRVSPDVQALSSFRYLPYTSTGDERTLSWGLDGCIRGHSSGGCPPCSASGWAL
jgi:aryl-alcohol dehydrogenase-like predicted oxidoreductase